MASVTGEIKRLLAQHQQRTADGVAVMQGILADLQKQVLAELAGVEGESYQAHHLRQNLAMIESAMLRFEAVAFGRLERLIDGAWDGGLDLVPGLLDTAGVSVVTSHLTGPVLQTAKDFAYYRIKNLSADTFNKIRGELSLGLLGQKTPWQVRQAIEGSLESPGVFKSIAERAKVIAELEMGRAYSQATQLSLEQAVQSVPGLKKQWWHAGHPKMPRRNHLALHGQIVDVDQKFLIGSVALRYPRDPQAPPSETIRCGCMVVPWIPAWGDVAKEGALPIYNERGEEIARRGPRTGIEESLAGKFKLGQVGRARPGNGPKKP